MPDAFEDPDGPERIESQRAPNQFIQGEAVDRQSQLAVGILKKPEGFELVIELTPIAEQSASGHVRAHQPCRLLHHFDAAAKSVARVQDPILAIGVAKTNFSPR